MGEGLGLGLGRWRAGGCVLQRAYAQVGAVGKVSTGHLRKQGASCQCSSTGCSCQVLLFLLFVTCSSSRVARSCCSLTAEECLARVQRSFDTRNDGGRLSPETEEQVKFVEEFIKAM